MVYTSKTHRIECGADGIIEGRQSREKTILETVLSSDGGIQQHRMPAKQLMPRLASDPDFVLGWDGEGFNCDISLGFQRWHGWQSERDVKKALKAAGLLNHEVLNIVRAAKQHTHRDVHYYH
jgi:hypothetical protein